MLDCTKCLYYENSHLVKYNYESPIQIRNCFLEVYNEDTDEVNCENFEEKLISEK